MTTISTNSMPKKSKGKGRSLVSTTDVAIKKSERKNIFRPDVKQTAVLVKVGRAGSANAIRASKALGLSITYMKNGVLYKEDSNGTKEIVSTSIKQNSASKKSSLPLKKGMLLHAKK